MEEQLTTQPPPGAEEVDKGALWNLQGIFFEPSKTFESINLHPRFLVALVLCILISIGLWTTIYSVIDFGYILESQIKDSPRAAQMTQEQIDEQIDQIENSALAPVIKWVGPIMGVPVIILVVAGALMLVIYLSGSETTFKKIMGVTSHTFFFSFLVSSVLTGLVFLLAVDPKAIDIQNPVYTNLGHLIDGKQQPLLYKILSSVDLIVWYTIYLMGLGAAKVSPKMTVGKGFGLVALLYVIYVLIGVGWKAVFG